MPDDHLPSKQSPRIGAGVAVALWCVAMACGRIGYEEMDGTTTTFGVGTIAGVGGSTLAGGGTRVAQVTTGGSQTATGGATGAGVTTGAGGSGGLSTTIGGSGGVTTTSGGAGGTSATTTGTITGTGTRTTGGIGGTTGFGGFGGTPTTSSTTGFGGSGGFGGTTVDAGLSGPILYWKFDEASGTQAIDSSGRGFHGAYVGSPTGPSRSTLVPPQIAFANPSSRQFTTNKQQAVQLASAPPALKPPNNVTMALWYKSPALDTVGGALASMGDNYLMFLHRSPAGIELSKVQAQLVDGGNAWTKCQATVPNYLDNNWHHVAGVISTTGMRIYFDGAQVASNPDGTSIVYPLGTDFFVGRHGNGDAGFDYDGNIDDVRIYDRALSDSEILQLSLGGS